MTSGSRAIILPGTVTDWPCSWHKSNICENGPPSSNPDAGRKAGHDDRGTEFYGPVFGTIRLRNAAATAGSGGGIGGKI